MKKIVIKILIFLIILVLYLVLGSAFNIYIGCPIHDITGFHCPGCGLTRMLLSILKLDFYQAYRYNPLLFITLPFIIFLYFNNLYCKLYNKKSIIKKIPNWFWYIILFIVILYGIMRNIIPYFAPTDI
ncbi:MAG: DUF2752 domain-containing protein [Bacilli bacterium]|nr:DUF2752 domain-containing protein [Bacilli bacterium]